jgi:hypothetical protein
LAVATTKTGAVFSWSQVRNEPNMRRDTPPSASPLPPPGVIAFSSSSIQRIAGAVASAMPIALRMLRSVSPMNLS